MLWGMLYVYDLKESAGGAKTSIDGASPTSPPAFARRKHRAPALLVLHDLDPARNRIVTDFKTALFEGFWELVLDLPEHLSLLNLQLAHIYPRCPLNLTPRHLLHNQLQRAVEHNVESYDGWTYHCHPRVQAN